MASGCALEVVAFATRLLYQSDSVFLRKGGKAEKDLRLVRGASVGKLPKAR